MTDDGSGKEPPPSSGQTKSAVALEKTTLSKSTPLTTVVRLGADGMRGVNDHVFIDEGGDSKDDSLRDYVITPEFVRKNQGVLRSQLDSLQRKERMEEVRSRLKQSQRLREKAPVPIPKRTDQKEICSYTKYKHTREKHKDSYSPYKGNGSYSGSYSDFPRFNFTPLTKTPSEILSTEREKISFVKPLPRKTKMKGNLNEYFISLGQGYKKGGESGKEKNSDKSMEIEYVDMIRKRETIGGELERLVKSHSSVLEWLQVSIAFVYVGEGNGQHTKLNITADIAGYKIARIHGDGGSGPEVIHEYYFNRLKREVRDGLVEDSVELV
ncbi:hypothetical protein QVD17_19695 [Tagetes erecta]|uniref:Uncharacterized protein n=1 Tax=Tagetes erecta TaxID=13708 RepID=A0AAD8NXJ0_TARER|nr:hypothetical protein QVD17_19695 [Tagetes erecta]